MDFRQTEMGIEVYRSQAFVARLIPEDRELELPYDNRLVFFHVRYRDRKGENNFRPPISNLCAALVLDPANVILTGMLASTSGCPNRHEDGGFTIVRPRGNNFWSTPYWEVPKNPECQDLGSVLENQFKLFAGDRIVGLPRLSSQTYVGIFHGPGNGNFGAQCSKKGAEIILYYPLSQDYFKELTFSLDFEGDPKITFLESSTVDGGRLVPS